jgi:hypothetical protein
MFPPPQIRKQGNEVTMALVSQAEHARLCNVSRKTVTMWKAAGKLTIVDGMVDHEANYKGDSWHGGAKKARQDAPAPAAKPAAKKARVAKPAASDKVKAAEPTADAPEVVPAGATALKEAILRKEDAAGRLRELEFLQRSGKLVETSLAEKVLFDEARAQRDAWINWPARVAALIASDLDVEADRVSEVLSTYVHQHLEQLGTPDRAFAQG